LIRYPAESSDERRINTVARISLSVVMVVSSLPTGLKPLATSRG